VGTPDLRITLQEEARVVVSVLDATSQAPVRGVSATGVRYGDRQGDSHALRGSLTVLVGAKAVEAAVGDVSPVGLVVARGLGTLRNTLVVSAPGYATRGFLLPTVPAPTVVTQSVSLERESGVTGRVLDGRGEPVAGAVVRLSAPAALRVPLDALETTTDIEGRYRFAALTHGDWSLVARAPSFLESEPRLVSAPKEQVVEDVEIVLLPAGRVRGPVVAADGTPALNVTVSAPPTEKQQGGNARKDVSARTTAEGRFEIDSLPTGDYSVGCFTADAGPVRVVAGAEVEVTLNLRAPPTVRGRVLEGGVAVAGATVVVEERVTDVMWYAEREVASDASGAFELTLPAAGRYRLGAEEGGAHGEVLEIEAAWGATLFVDLRFGSGRVAGRVRRADLDEPLQADVKLVFLRTHDGSEPVAQDGVLDRDASCDAAGRFAVGRLVAGHYEMRASMSGFVDATTEVEVRDGATTEAAVIALAPAGELRGSVRTSAGTPPPGPLSMLLTRVGEDSPVRQWNLREDGTYTAARLPPGNYRIAVVRKAQPAAGGPPVTTTLDERPGVLLAGETTVADLLVSP
jgi:hypothetical protein